MRASRIEDITPEMPKNNSLSLSLCRCGLAAIREPLTCGEARCDGGGMADENPIRKNMRTRHKHERVAVCVGGKDDGGWLKVQWATGL